MMRSVLVRFAAGVIVILVVAAILTVFDYLRAVSQ